MKDGGMKMKEQISTIAGIVGGFIAMLLGGFITICCTNFRIVCVTKSFFSCILLGRKYNWQ